MKYVALVLVAACGPIYPQQQTQPPVGDPAANEPGYGQQQPASGQPSNNGQGFGPGGPGAQTGQPGARVDEPPSGPPSGPPGPPPHAQRGATPPPSAPTGMAAALVASHNARRAKHCAAPLSWSQTLADYAQRWANNLRAQGCKFEHSQGQYGENLAGGSTGSLDAEGIVGMWYDEIKSFDFRGGGFSMDTGHFTQVVWRGTTQVGCGTVNCNGMDIWVCEYDPAGNVEGEYRQNVASGGACR